MNERRIGAAIAVVLLACCGAQAQELHVPKFLVWQAGPGPDTGAFPALTRMVHVPLTNWGTHSWVAADIAAREAVVQIHDRLNLPQGHPDHLEEDQVCLTFDGSFARFDGWIDDPTWFFYSPLRFYQEGDRLKTVQHPTGLDEPPYFPFTETGGRTYRNPFLRNADPDPQVAKLKGWMEAFLTQFKAIRDAEYPDVHNPRRFYLDMEVDKGWNAGSAVQSSNASNTRDMLYVLATETDLDPAVGRLWTGRVLPPYFGSNVTLDTLYQAECAPLTGVADVRNAIRTDQPPDSDRNRPVMLWWDSVLRRAEDAVYKNCFHDVVHAAFPPSGTYPGCKTSNYDSMNLDGVFPTTTGGQPIPNTGWYLGSNDTRKVVNSVEVYPARVPMNTVARGKVQGWYLDGSRFWKEANGTWDVTRKYASGDMNAPELYHMADALWWRDGAGNGFGNYPNGSPVPSHQQPILYLGSDRGPDFQHPDRRMVLETRQESGMRLFRSRVEACIDSYGGHHEDTLAPWVYAAGSEERAQALMYSRRLLSMLRAFNAPEVVVFQGADMNRWFPVTRALGTQAWQRTQPVVEQVYASRVSHYEAYTPPSTYVQSAGSGDLSKLEFVLKDAAGNARTVDIASGPGWSPGQPWPAETYTALMVDFSGLQNYPTQYLASQAGSGNGYQVTVEGNAILASSSSPSVNAITTSIAAYDWKHNTWNWIRQIDPVEDNAAAQTTPPRYSDSIAAATWTPDGSFRIICDLRASVTSANGPEYVAKDTIYAADGTLRLMIVQRQPTNPPTTPPDYPWGFASKYDLVQVVPFPYVAPPPAPYPGPRQPEPVSGALDYPALYVANPTVPMGVFTATPLTSLDAGGSEPLHYADWHAGYEFTHWPQLCITPGQFTNTRLLNTTFSLPVENELHQVATARFTGPIWTNAPEQIDPALQPYKVWYWFVYNNGGTQMMEWHDLTSAMNVAISRDSSGASSQIVVSSKATQTLPPGYYALCLNVTKPAGDPNVTGEPYAVYCTGSLAAPGLTPATNAYLYDQFGNYVPAVQYNFRLYPDCNTDHCIDEQDQQCNINGGLVCFADLDDGNGAGVHDGGVDINDLLFFLAHYEAGDFHADLDDGNGNGSPDGGVDINDLLFFLTHYEYGC